MGSWTSDQQLIALMRAYVVASNRLENFAGRPDIADEVVDACRVAQRRAAVEYEEALVARGWQIPGLLSGTPAQAAMSF